MQNCTLLTEKIQVRKGIIYVNVLYIHSCVKRFSFFYFL